MNHLKATFHLRLKASFHLPGDPKLMMTSQFSQESLHRYLPDSRLHNKGEEKKENELVFFRKLTPVKSKLSRSFLLLSFLELLKQVI